MGWGVVCWAAVRRSGVRLFRGVLRGCRGGQVGHSYGTLVGGYDIGSSESVGALIRLVSLVCVCRSFRVTIRLCRVVRGMRFANGCAVCSRVLCTG